MEKRVGFLRETNGSERAAGAFGRVFEGRRYLGNGKIGIDLVECGQGVFDGSDLFRGFVLGFEDIGHRNRHGTAVRIVPFGKSVGKVTDLPSGEMAEAGEDFIKEFVFSFG